MNEEQIEWLKQNLSIEIKTGSWADGIEISLQLNDTDISKQHVPAWELKDAIGIER